MGTENKMQVMDRRYDVILLDVDGTLLDFKLSEKLGMEHVMRISGVEPTRERLELYHGISEGSWSVFERGEVTKERLVQERFNVFFARLGTTVDGHATKDLYCRQLDNSAFLIDGALDLCQHPKERHDLYAVTNGTPSTQYKRPAAPGLDCFMRDISAFEDVGSQKPQKEYFEYCFKRILGVCLECMFLVGDSLSSGIKGGQVAGTATCWYNSFGLINRTGVRPDLKIYALGELKRIL